MRAAYRIDAPHFCAGFEADASAYVVVRAAPIIKYMQGWGVQKVRDYCFKKGWALQAIEILPEENEAA